MLQLGNRRLQSLLAILQSSLLQLQIRDIGADAHITAVVRPPLADLDPAAVGNFQSESFPWVSMALYGCGYPFLDAAERRPILAPLSTLTDDVFERSAGDQEVGTEVEHLAVVLVAENKAIVPVEQDEALAHTLDGVVQTCQKAAPLGKQDREQQARAGDREERQLHEFQTLEPASL